MKRQNKKEGHGQKIAPNVKNPAIVALGKRIKLIRKQKGYTSLYDFAYEHEISRGQYARFEQGANMTFLNFLKVAQAFGVTMSELFEGLEDSIESLKSVEKRSKK